METIWWKTVQIYITKFCYICPSKARYILTVPHSWSTPFCSASIILKLTYVRILCICLTNIIKFYQMHGSNTKNIHNGIYTETSETRTAKTTVLWWQFPYSWLPLLFVPWCNKQSPVVYSCSEASDLHVFRSHRWRMELACGDMRTWGIHADCPILTTRNNNTVLVKVN
jgi:hypothetical protein